MINPRIAGCFLAAFLFVFAPLALAQGTYTQIDVPGASYTSVWGINTVGDVVGYYDGSGFLLSGGIFTTIVYPGALATFAYGINDQQQIVGQLRPNNSNQFIGFLYDIPSQTFSTFQYSPDTLIYPLAINNAGTIVGTIQRSGTNSTIGFELNGITYTKIVPPDAAQTGLTAVNNVGECLGITTSKSGTRDSFLLKGGKLVKLDSPNNVFPYGINDLDELTGSYTRLGQESGGFVYKNGVHQSLIFPGSASTVATAINNSGEVVGFFYDAAGNLHGFLWTPPGDAAKK